MTPANPGPLLSSRPNPSLPPIPRHRRSHTPAAANTTGVASSPDWFRPRRTPDTDTATSGGRVTARDPGVRVNAKEGADGKKKEEGRKRRWWERWSRDKESYLVDDVEPLPLPMTLPGAEPMSREELDRRLSCDVEVEDCFVRMDGQMPELPGDGAGELLQKEGEGDHLQIKLLIEIGIRTGYVRKITYRQDAEKMDELDNGKPP
ncbi:hypothetical protein PR202_ga15637 [Eleusine coracana subsp. coracana]|uniref:Uncharacterized protein n=1 Tax=Eleusine coracana subsp. coracana TaxID=191504 RepID=A0AAV5CKD5_ELECO|nr:hypothetical protein PR202_ga15637 [Eleusine coracana subsp. coracana]